MPITITCADCSHYKVKLTKVLKINPYNLLLSEFDYTLEEKGGLIRCAKGHFQEKWQSLFSLGIAEDCPDFEGEDSEEDSGNEV